jgi:hypothetical protein
MPALGGDSAFAESMEVRSEDALVGDLRVEYGARYPVGDSDGELAASEYESLFDQLLNETLFLVRKVLEADKPRSSVKYWGDVLTQLRTNDDNDPARHALVVDLAETLLAPLEHITSQPKKVLKRIRDQQRVQLVQEVDMHCLIDLARRPGSTLPEKAGPKQRVLAVTRQETTNVLENRVARHCCELLRRAAGRYLRSHRNVTLSARKDKVADLQQASKRLPQKAAFMEVGHMRSPCRQPNYALLQNIHYARIWQGYTRLVRNEELRESLWRWPRRLWADRVKVYVADTVLALAQQSGRSVSVAMAERLVQAAQVHRFGAWMAVDVMPGPFVLGSSFSDSGTLYIIDGAHADIIDARYAESSLLCADLLAVWVKGRVTRVLPIYATWPSPSDRTDWDREERERIGQDVLSSVNSFNTRAKNISAVGALLVHGIQDAPDVPWQVATQVDRHCWQVCLSPDVSTWPVTDSHRFAPFLALMKD